MVLMNIKKKLQKLWSNVYVAGLPHAFVTVNPSLDGKVQIKFMANGFPEHNYMWEIPSDLVPTDAEHTMLASENAGIAASWFQRKVDAYIHLVLGFDEEKQLPLKNGGLYGLVQMVVRAAQTTKGQRLHCHMLIWISNFMNPNSPTPFFSANQSFHRLHGHTPLSVTTTESIQPMLSESSSSQDVNDTATEIQSQTFALEAFIQYIDSSTTHGPPSIIPIVCPNCLKKDSLAPIPKFPLSAFKRHRTNATTFKKEGEILNICSECHQGFGGTAILLHYLCSCLTHLKKITNVAIEACNSCFSPTVPKVPLLEYDDCKTFGQIISLLDDLSCIPFEQYKTHVIGRLLEPQDGFTPNEEITNVTIDILILYRALKLNQHATNHTFTCFKKNAICRFEIPRVTNKFTYIDEETGEIKIQLLLGSEYINAYNSDLFMTFPMNHDFRHLMRIQVSDGDAATVQQSLSVNACYYTIVYIIEKSKSVENNMMYKVTLERRKQREAALALDPNEMEKTIAQKSLGLTMSLVHSNIKGVETDVTTAAYFALGNQTIFFSLPTNSNFMLTQFLAYVENNSIDIELTAVPDMSSPSYKQKVYPNGSDDMLFKQTFRA